MSIFGIDEIVLFKYQGSGKRDGRFSRAMSSAGVSVAYAEGGADAPGWIDKDWGMIGIEAPLMIVNPYNEAVAIEDIRVRIKSRKYIVESFTPAELHVIEKNKKSWLFYPLLLEPMYENYVSVFFPTEIHRRFLFFFSKKIKMGKKMPDIEKLELVYNGTITIKTNKGVLRYSAG